MIIIRLISKVALLLVQYDIGLIEFADAFLMIPN